MTDNDKMVDLPWHDGTTRTVPEWTSYEGCDGYLAFAREGGYSFKRTEGSLPFDHSANSAAVRIIAEAPEPPVKVNVPTGLAAVVSMSISPDDPGCVLTRKGWRGLRTDVTLDSSQVANELRAGARVLFEGVDE